MWSMYMWSMCNNLIHVIFRTLTRNRRPWEVFSSHLGSPEFLRGSFAGSFAGIWELTARVNDESSEWELTARDNNESSEWELTARVKNESSEWELTARFSHESSEWEFRARLDRGKLGECVRLNRSRMVQKSFKQSNLLAIWFNASEGWVDHVVLHWKFRVRVDNES